MTDALATFALDTDHRKALALRYLGGAKVGDGLEVVIRKVVNKRSVYQNRRWWSMLGALAKSGHVFAGQTWDAEDWHTIMLSAFWTEKRGEAPKVIEGLASEFLCIGHSSRGLSVSEFGDLMTMTLAYIDQNQVEWIERNMYPEEPLR